LLCDQQGPDAKTVLANLSRLENTDHIGCSCLPSTNQLEGLATTSGVQASCGIGFFRVEHGMETPEEGPWASGPPAASFQPGPFQLTPPGGNSQGGMSHHPAGKNDSSSVVALGAVRRARETGAPWRWQRRRPRHQACRSETAIGGHDRLNGGQPQGRRSRVSPVTEIENGAVPSLEKLKKRRKTAAGTTASEQM